MRDILLSRHNLAKRKANFESFFSFSAEWLDKINIKVCIKGGACHICGNPDAVPGGSWSTVTCMGGPIEGNEIQLRNEAHHLQFCEMVIYGIRKFCQSNAN